MSVRYKFVEVAPVTAETLEKMVNARVAEGWQLDVIHFAMREGSHRPAMAFVSFIRDDPPEQETTSGTDDAPKE